MQDPLPPQRYIRDECDENSLVFEDYWGDRVEIKKVPHNGRVRIMIGLDDDEEDGEVATTSLTLDVFKNWLVDGKFPFPTAQVGDEVTVLDPAGPWGGVVEGVGDDWLVVRMDHISAVALVDTSYCEVVVNEGVGADESP